MVTDVLCADPSVFSVLIDDLLFPSFPQIGGELMDFIIVLHGSKAVKTFCSRMHFSLGAGCSAAAGPVGRVLEADLRAGDRGSGMCYTYSCSKGIVSWRSIYIYMCILECFVFGEFQVLGSSS